MNFFERSNFGEKKKKIWGKNCHFFDITQLKGKKLNIGYHDYMSLIIVMIPICVCSEPNVGERVRN
jgi:hypothetical protein